MRVPREQLKNATPMPVRRAAREALAQYGALTSPWRPVPDFLIIGTKRGGTTSLWNYLLEHPLVPRQFPAWNTKSSHYFEENWHRGQRWYLGHFPTRNQRRRLEKRHGGSVRAGEASPLYSFHPLAPDRVKAVLPNTRLICLLRDPVDRAFSHWKERRTNGVETLDFADALSAEEARIDGEYAHMLADENYFSEAWDWYSYRTRGRYLEHLEPWLDRFDRSQLLILRSEDLYLDTPGTYRRVTDFLGLPPWELRRYEVFNDRKSAEMPEQIRRELTEYYAPLNQQLEERLGMTLGWSSPLRK